MERRYNFAVSIELAKAEWEEFQRADEFIRGLGQVRFEANDGGRSELCVSMPDGSNTIAMDAVVQRFRDRLARKGKPSPY
jgi:hypothetical protein